MGRPSMRRLSLSTENLTAGIASMLLRRHINSFCTRRVSGPGRTDSVGRQRSQCVPVRCKIVHLGLKH